MTPEFHNLVQNKNHDVQTFAFAYFTQRILQINQPHMLAIMVYGSCLNDKTKSATSTPDFYVLVDDYRKFYKKPLDRFLNSHLPPNIYHLQTPQGPCKYCVISLAHLEKEVSDHAKDVYHLGRFSKRMGLLWVQDAETEKRVVHAQMKAILSVTKKVLLSINHSFSLDEFIQRALFLSYEGDVRIESTDKVQKIMHAEKSYYEKAFQFSLADLGVKKKETTYVIHKSAWKHKIDRARFLKFIHQSRIRARLRWPKNMFTVEQWLDYMTAKIERTHGIKIELTPTERKFWYIFGWKHFYRLYRKKLIK